MIFLVVVCLAPIVPHFQVYFSGTLTLLLIFYFLFFIWFFIFIDCFFSVFFPHSLLISLFVFLSHF